MSTGHLQKTPSVCRTHGDVTHGGPGRDMDSSYLTHNTVCRTEKHTTISAGKTVSPFMAYVFESPSFGSYIDLNKVVFRTEPGKTWK